MWKSSPVDSINLDPKEMAGRPFQVLNTLYHLHVYLQQNGKLDGYDPSVHTIAWSKRSGKISSVDNWALSLLKSTVEGAASAYREGRYNDACRLIEQMTVETLSQNYVRMVRNELWRDTPEEKTRRLTIYSIMGTILSSLDLLLHPVSPFLTEFLFQEVFHGSNWDEPLLLQTPIELELPQSATEDMKMVESVLEVESACNSARMKAKLKRRWPARRLVVLLEPAKVARLKKGRALLASLCNVKDVAFKSSVMSMPVTVSFLPIRSQIGEQFKGKSGEVLEKLRGIEGEKGWKAYKSGKPIVVDIEGKKMEVSPAAFELELKGVGEWEASAKGGVLVALEKVRDDGLIAEGLVRDLARRLQTLRKKRGRDPAEMLQRARVAGLNEETLRLVEPLLKDLAFLVRAERVEALRTRTAEGSWEDEEFDGNLVYLDIE